MKSGIFLLFIIISWGDLFSLPLVSHGNVSELARFQICFERGREYNN